MIDQQKEQAKPSPILYMPKLYRLLMELQHAGHIDEAHIKMISSDIEVYTNQSNQEWIERVEDIIGKDESGYRAGKRGWKDGESAYQETRNGLRAEQRQKLDTLLSRKEESHE